MVFHFVHLKPFNHSRRKRDVALYVFVKFGFQFSLLQVKQLFPRSNFCSIQTFLVSDNYKSSNKICSIETALISNAVPNMQNMVKIQTLALKRDLV